MDTRLVIDPGLIPDEGKNLAGELSEEIFDLPEGDAKALSPLHYDLWVQRFGAELLLTGSLWACFDFNCVRTLHSFRQTIRLEHAAISLECVDSAPIDATEALREEILIHFPANPSCDQGDEPQECEIDSRYLSVDKPPRDGLATPPRDLSDDRWSALDALKNLKDQP
ncbi:MAG: YceD family protein [Luteolibacter sp.]